MRADRTLPLLLDGYLYLTRQREDAGRDTVPLGLLGQRATTLVGPEATKLFYDATAFERHGVIPPNVRQTLFGDVAVHLLDGSAHHQRKSLFVDVLDRAGTEALVASVDRAWEQAASCWEGRRIVLFDEAADVLTAAVHAWAGVPLDPSEVRDVASDLVAMVDGFGSLGGRYLKARRARRRQEHRIAALAARMRVGSDGTSAASPFSRVVGHRQADGTPLDDHTVAVETLNLLRPTVALCWFVTYAAHALHHWPEERVLLAGGDPAQALAFAHEVRRFYPFAPLLAARATRDLLFDGVTIPAGSLGVLDVFGQDHHADLWTDPWRFSSARFLAHPPGMFDLIPQGGGDPVSGHRCPGEPASVQILAALAPRVAGLGTVVPDQDLAVTRRRLPARVRSGMVLDVGPRLSA